MEAHEQSLAWQFLYSQRRTTPNLVSPHGDGGQTDRRLSDSSGGEYSFLLSGMLVAAALRLAF